MDNKKIYLSVSAIVLLTAIGGYLKFSNVDTENEVSLSSASSNDDNYQIDNEVQSAEGKLTIDSRCRGCGRCAMIDSEHFSHGIGRSTPTVISQDNLDSSLLQRAIENCPSGSISIET